LQNPAPTNARFGTLRALVAAAAVAAFLALPSTAGATALWPDPAKSPTASTVKLLYFIVFIVGFIAVIALTLKLLGDTRNEVDADAPEVAETSTKPALIVGVVLFVVLAALGAYSLVSTTSAADSLATTTYFKSSPLQDPQLKVAHTVKPPKNASYSVHVNAQQFLWRYTYPSVKGDWHTYSYPDLVIPAGITVMLDVTSSDVEAGWWVPQLGGSIDAMPGYINKGWIRADKVGVYPGAGTVVNGTNYANMTTSVIALPPALFARWADGKQIEISAAMKALGLERLSGEEAALITGKAFTPAAPAPTEPTGGK
jgi:cytochrome c oxidase subunit 2